MFNLQMATTLIGREVDQDKLIIYFDLIERKIRNYCHIPANETLNPDLDYIIMEMVVSYYNLLNPAESGADVEKEISSIKRGDTTISYGSEAKQVTGSMGMKTVDDFVSDYYFMLKRFRRLPTLRKETVYERI